jgi:hypothetical protein
MVMEGARKRKSHGKIEKSGRRWACPMRKKVLKNNQFENKIKVMMKMYAIGELK